jgi:chromosomal replication initiation ATPase DnaA
MYAVYGRHTQAGIERRRAEQHLARLRQDNAPKPVVRLVEPREDAEAEIVRQKRELAIANAAERSRAFLEESGQTRFKHTYILIEKRLCGAFKITKAELRSKRRSREIVLARQAVMYWTCRLTQRSLPEIGRMMGGKDHTTILHGRDAYPTKRAKMGRNLRAVR